jgi:hypothetical protein
MSTKDVRKKQKNCLEITNYKFSLFYQFLLLLYSYIQVIMGYFLGKEQKFSDL